MVSPTNNNNSFKYRSLDPSHLAKLQTNLKPYLKNDRTLLLLKSLIQKYESYSLEEIDNYLFTNFKKFKDITHHKIREFVQRRLRNEKKLGQINTVYQSDESNLVSPYSRDSFSSKSDINVSPNNLTGMKIEISKLWKYPTFQRQICQILHDNGNLDLENSKVSINFETLKQSTILNLKDFINVSNKQIQKYLSDKNIKILHDIFMEQHISDEKINSIYSIIRKRNNITVDKTGKFFIDVYALKPETVSDLIKFLCYKQKIEITYPIKSSSSSSLSSSSNSMLATENNNIKSEKIVKQVKSSDISSQSRFTTEHLRFLHTSVSEFQSDSDEMRKIISIIREHEPLNQKNNEISFNFRKMKEITLEKMYNVIKSYKK